MNQTIAAIASGMTASGIGIIRISGPEAFPVLAGIFRPKRAADVTAYRSNTIHYGTIIDEDGNDLDECLVMIMRGPKTYTTEDTVEIDCHGGILVMNRVLQRVLSAGVRMAEPGEFTKRAFLGGRIDLAEAEAVMDLIQAKNDRAAKNSLMQLSGSLSRRIRTLRDGMLDEIAYIEAALDDPEHYDLSGYGETSLLPKLKKLEAELRRLSATFREGKLVREGILTVILGRPNAGKSSLLNTLSGEDRAIVTDIEGTTRDILEEQVRIADISLRIIDTAGIREARDKIEQIGIGRAKEYAEAADLILAVFDASLPLNENDREILSLIRGRKAIILLNKSDLHKDEADADRRMEEIRAILSGYDPAGNDESAGDQKTADFEKTADYKMNAGDEKAADDEAVGCDMRAADDKVTGYDMRAADDEAAGYDMRAADDKAAGYDMRAADDEAVGYNRITCDDEPVGNEKAAADKISADNDKIAAGDKITGSVKNTGNNNVEIPPILSISARENTGIDELGECIRRLFFEGSIDVDEESMLTSSRHRDLVEQAIRSVTLAEEGIYNQMTEDFIVIDLMDAYRSLGEIIGEEIEDDLADRIFSKFCMGK